MEELNLYAAPKVSLQKPEGDVVWRDGKILVIRRDTTPPHRCIRCNQPGALRERKLTWYNPWINLLFFLNILILAVVVLVVRKRATISVGLCEHHQQRYDWGRIIGLAGTVLMFGLIFYGIGHNETGLVALGLIGLIALLILWRVFSGWLVAAGIDENYVRVRGCGKPFLDSLPDFALRWQAQAPLRKS